MPLAAARKAVAAYVRSLPAPARGALWMAAGALVFSGLNALVRDMTAELPAFELAFFRAAFSLMFMLPWVLKLGLGSLKTQRIRLYSARALISAASMMLWFSALALLPLADAVALSFTGPLFATAGAALMLREQVGWRRWTAVCVGFAGVLIIAQPGAALSLGAGLALGSALCMAATALMVKSLTRTEPANAIVVYMVIYLAPIMLIPALFVWQWPAAHHWPGLAAMGALGTVGHLCFTRALIAADASAVMPYDYLRLPFAAAIAYLVLAETPAPWTWVGAGVIMAASAYIAHREIVLRRAPAARESARPE